LAAALPGREAVMSTFVSVPRPAIVLGFGTGESPSPGIADWVSENFTSTTVGACTIYDLTAPTGWLPARARSAQ
jgi:hypothetical protein